MAEKAYKTKYSFGITESSLKSERPTQKETSGPTKCFLTPEPEMFHLEKKIPEELLDRRNETVAFCCSVGAWGPLYLCR